MEKFIAAQAREMMPSRFNEMIERIHNHIRNMAVNGGSVVTVTFLVTLTLRVCLLR